jgi:hypothetical protein
VIFAFALHLEEGESDERIRHHHQLVCHGVKDMRSRGRDVANVCVYVCVCESMRDILLTRYGQVLLLIY